MGGGSVWGGGGGVPENRWVRKGKEGCGQREIFKPR